MSKKSYREFVGELSKTIVESRDTRKSKPGDQKGCKKLRDDGALSLCARSGPPLSHVYLACYSSKRPVMQARHRLRGGRGGGSTLLFMLSLLSVCGIKGGRF